MDYSRIDPLLKKKPWKRLLADDAMARPMSNPDFYDISDPSPGLNYQHLSNEDLLKESTEGAHLINSNVYSSRPVYDVVERKIEVLNDKGIVEEKTVMDEVIVGYDDVETVRSGLPDLLIRQKASHLGKNGIEIADEGADDKEGFDFLCSYKDASGVDAAWVDLLYSAGKCGDAALYIYRIGSEFGFSIYSTEEGSTLFEHKDSRGRPVLVRLYKLRGRSAVDIFTSELISTWIKGDPDDFTPKSEPDKKSWWDLVKGWFRGASPMRRSEDGWTCVDTREPQIGSNVLQIVYLRLQDTFIGEAMQNINALDRALSYTSDKMRSTAFSKFMVKALKIKNLPPLSSGEEVIGIEGDAETLKASDAKHLPPPDISNIATINLKNIKDAIMNATMSVDLPPEILKSGADSSQTLKILMRREIQWCHVMWPRVMPAARHAVAILKAMADKTEGGGGRFSRLRTSVWNTPWIPQDEDAIADRMCKLSYASLISQKNGRRELNLQYTDDEELIRKEQEAKIYRETYIKLKAQADARRDFGLEETANDIIEDKSVAETDPAKQRIDNNAPNKP